jgi:ankyrin repeat protein
VKVLVEKCPECVDVVHEGLVPLHAASLNGHVDVAKYLLGVRPDQIDVKTDDEMTVLHLASQEGVLELVEYLADLCPALVEAKMPDATLAFHLACSEDHETTMTALLSRTKSETVVDSRSNGNRTFLHHVALQGSVALTTWLLDKHPSLLTCKDEHGNIALHMASSRGHLELVRLLLSKDSEQVSISCLCLLDCVFDCLFLL